MTDEAVGEELSRVRQRAPRDALRSDQIQSVEQMFAVYTDHASLRTAMKSPHLFQHMARWLPFFAEYNFVLLSLSALPRTLQCTLITDTPGPLYIATASTNNDTS